MNEDLYSGHILTGIEVKKAGWRKTAKDIAEEGAKATGISRERASGQVLLLDGSLVRRLNNPGLLKGIEETTRKRWPM